MVLEIRVSVNDHIRKLSSEGSIGINIISVETLGADSTLVTN